MCRKNKLNNGLSGCGGFTLMELLVVISIISLLMSILLPGLSGAREQGKRVHCAANLRNLTWAWFMYAGEHDGKLCSADSNWNFPGNNWVADGPVMPGNPVGGTQQAIRDGTLWSYVTVLGTYKCKSDRSDLLRSYCISRTMNGKSCNCEHDNINAFKMLSHISRPAGKMLFVDAHSLEGWLEGSFCPVQQIDADPPAWFRRPSRNITARHSGGFNMSFADSHTEYWKYKDLRTVKFANWQIGSAEASPDNPDLRRFVESLKGLGQ
ncbi:MAG: type II secretion system protein [Planctomycetota bacterium]